MAGELQVEVANEVMLRMMRSGGEKGESGRRRRRRRRTDIKEEDVVVVPPVGRVIGAAEHQDGLAVKGHRDMVVPHSRGGALDLRG